MKKLLFFVIGLVVIAGGWYLFANKGGIGSSAPATLNADVYPLYSGVTWSEAVATTSPDHGAVTVVQAIAATDTMNIAEASMPFTKYYDDKLTAAGWMRDNAEEASGPGANVSVYRKGDQFVVVSFRSDFKVRSPNAPVQCPCDVTLSLASGTQVGPTRAEEAASHVYTDAILKFSVTLPTALATQKSDTLWSVDTSYQYTGKGADKAIGGVKFTIPASLAAGTNLAADSYVSVENLPAGGKCDAAVFSADSNAKSKTVKEGVRSYSFTSMTDAAVGNRYEETIYALPDSKPCLAVRYYVHYAAIENFPDGSVKAFDKVALLQEFDQVRRTLVLGN